MLFLAASLFLLLLRPDYTYIIYIGLVVGRLCRLGSFRAGLAASAACGGEPLRASAARRLRLAALRAFLLIGRLANHRFINRSRS